MVTVVLSDCPAFLQSRLEGQSGLISAEVILAGEDLVSSPSCSGHARAQPAISVQQEGGLVFNPS